VVLSWCNVYIDESLVFLDLTELSLDGIMPLSVTNLFIKLHCFFICLCYFIAILDIPTAVMTMSGFQFAPRGGHLDRLNGHLSKMRYACIGIGTDEPDYSGLPELSHDWSRSVYGEIPELVPHDAPEPLGKHVVLTHYVDANLMHDVVTGRYVTGILHLANITPIDWYSKKQATVETATYGSEFVAARICVESS
jgi:hypothetical protein